MDARLKEIIDESQNIVFLAARAFSTESNIPDFRSEQGLIPRQTGVWLCAGGDSFAYLYAAYGNLLRLLQA